MQFKRLATTLQLAAFLALVFGQPATTEDRGVDGFTLTDREAAFAKLREIVASSNAPTRFGQKRKRNLLEKSPT